MILVLRLVEEGQPCLLKEGTRCTMVRFKTSGRAVVRVHGVARVVHLRLPDRLKCYRAGVIIVSRGATLTTQLFQLPTKLLQALQAQPMMLQEPSLQAFGVAGA